MPSRASPREMWPDSVGNMAPPPSRTFTLHTPHVPLPPQAEGRKICWLARVLNSDPPAGTFKVFPVSSLISMLTSPVLTSFDLATIRMTTRLRMTMLNINMPRRMICITSNS